jgi:hypothetical protein
MMIRPEYAVLAALPLVDVALELRAALAERAGRGARVARLVELARGLAMGALGAAIAFSPQMIAWRIQYGTLATIPQGQSFMQWGASLWSEVLFHPRAGLLPWTPLAVPSLVGLGLLWRRERGLAGPLFALVALVVYVNGAAWDWWGGYSYGARRCSSLFAPLALGLAVFIQAAWPWLERNARRVAAAGALAVLVFFCALNLQMMASRRTGDVDWYRHRRFYEVYVSALERFGRAVHSTVGNPLSWPANLIYAARYRTSPGNYDIVAGRYFLGEANPYINPTDDRRSDRLDLASDGSRPFLVRGFGPPFSEGRTRVVPVVEERACVLLPLIQRPDIKLVLTGRAEWPRTTLGAEMNRRSLGAPRPLGLGFERVELAVPAALLRRGINELCLIHAAGRGPTSERRIGSTGARAPVDIAILSAGYADGNSSEIWVGGKQVGRNTRGMNAVAVDPASGALRGAEHFDLCWWPNGSELFGRWAAGLPAGTIVALAVRDDASQSFKPEAKRALELLGAATDLRGKRRHGYAAVGVRGAPARSALEQLAIGRPAVLVVGERPRPWQRIATYRGVLELLVTKPMAAR